jgi:hypothetical protein
MEKTIDLEGLWAKYSSLFKRAFGDTNEVNNFLDKFGERIVVCPAAHKVDQKYCEPGGLMKQSVDIAIAMKKIAESLSLDVEPASLLRVALGHDLGKIGSKDSDYYLTQDSDWHREKLGAHYKFNEATPRMPITHMSLHLLSSSGITLSLDETRAITTSHGIARDENKAYGYINTPLQSIVQSARLLTIQTK